MRSFLPLLGVPAACACGLVAGFEIGYWRLLPPTPSESPPLPPVARAALWAELGGSADSVLSVSFPFLAPEIAALMLDVAADRPPRPSNGLVYHLAKTQMFVLQHEGKVSPGLRHSDFALRELAIATWISRHWSPTQAVDAYGALAQMGGDRRGLRAGAEYYFGRPLESLDVADTVLLVAITRYPSRLDPPCFPERALAARNQLLARMVVDGTLDASAACRAAATPLGVTRDCNRLAGTPGASRRARS